jgi:hypothetical protein
MKSSFGSEIMLWWLRLIALCAALAGAAHVSAQQITKIRVANIGGTSDHIQVAINDARLPDR